MRRNAGPTTSRAEKPSRRSSHAPESGKPLRKGRDLSHLYARLLTAAALIRNVLFIVVTVAILIYLWHAVQDTSIYVEPISVPPSLADRGLTSTVLTDKVVDQTGRIAREARETSNQADSPEIHAVTDIPEFRVFTFGPTLQSLGRQVRRALGKNDTRIAGSIVRNDSTWHVAMRNAETHVVAAMDVPNAEPLQDAIADAAAVAILRISSPGTLMRYQYANYYRTRDPAILNSLEATLNYREGIAGELDDRDVRYMRALVSFERGDFRSAQESYLRLAREYPGWTMVKAMAAMVANAAGHYDEANTLLNEIIQSNETHANTLGNAAFTLLSLGRTRDALGLAARSMQADSSYENARILVADILVALHRPNEAVKLLNDWKPMTPRNAVWARRVLAESYWVQGDLHRLQEVREILERQFPDDVRIFAVAGMEAELRGNWSAARDLYARLNAKSPRQGAQVDVARVLLKEGNPATAIPMLEHFLVTKPMNVEGRALLSRAYAMSGRFSAADAEYAKVIAADPDDVEALREWSDVLAKLGRPEEANGKVTLANEAAKRLTVPLAVPIPRKP